MTCTSIISQQCAALLDRWRAFVKEEEESGTREVRIRESGPDQGVRVKAMLRGSGDGGGYRDKKIFAGF